LLVTALLFFPDVSSAQSKGYQIGPNDILSLTIYAGGEKQYESDLNVSNNGTINAPFVGIFRANGPYNRSVAKDAHICPCKRLLCQP